MDLLYSEACKDCISKHIGPALNKVLDPLGRDYCGGCGKFTDKYRFSYWYPWPEDES